MTYSAQSRFMNVRFSQLEFLYCKILYDDEEIIEQARHATKSIQDDMMVPGDLFLGKMRFKADARMCEMLI